MDSIVYRRANRIATWPTSEQTSNTLWGGEHLVQSHHPRHGRKAWMSRSSTERKEARADRNSFHRAMMPILVIAQCFTVLPVQGITEHTPSSLRFRWLSLRALYSLVGITFVGFLTAHWTSVLFNSGFKLGNLNPVVFYGTTLLNMILFLKLAIDWPLLVQEIHKLELTLLLQYGYCKRFARDARLLTLVFLVAACTEHLLSISKSVILSVRCSDSTFGWITFYLRNFYGHIFKYVAYSAWIGSALFFTDNVATFAWNFMDLFIMIVSIMLKQRFQQFNIRMKSMLNEVVPKRTWREMREDFSTLAGMVAAFDARINKLVLVSFWNNLYFVCVQLYYSIISTRTLEEAIYFYSSFGFLLTRFIVVCLYAAAVNEESKEPIPVLYSVPSESYCREVQRFIDQATGENIALSALNFFSLTRTLLLTVAGTIVTYEMIMVQLNTSSGSMSANQTTAENGTDVNPFCPDH